MVQRIQTVYLLGAAILMALLLLMPLGTVASEGSTELAPVRAGDFTGLVFGIGLLVGGLVGSVLLFGNRPRQMRIVQLMMLLTVGLMAWVAVALFQFKGNVAEGQVFAFRLGAVFPFLSLVVQFMALNKIRQDHKLVKSMDRLR